MNKRWGDAFLCRDAVMTAFHHIFELLEQMHCSAPVSASDSTVMALAGHVSRAMMERDSHSRKRVCRS